MRAPSARPTWSHLLHPVACAFLLACASGADDAVTAPAADLPGPTPDFARSGLASKRAQLEPVKDKLSAGAYAFFFGQHKRALRLGTRLLTPGTRGAQPRDLRDVLANDRSQLGLGQSEITTADRGGTIVLAWNDAAGFYQFDEGVTGWGVSFDRGRTFLDGGSLPRRASPGFIHFGDPGLAAGGNTFFLSDLCADFATNPALSAVCVTSGRRGGRTIGWQTPVYAASSLPDFLDKPFIASDRHGRDVYVSYTRFQATGGQPIEVVASHDGGRSFGAPVVVGPDLGLGQQWSEPAVGPDGEVYVTWLRESSPGSATANVMIVKSTDGGRSFSAPGVVRTILPVFEAPSGYNRDFIAVSPRIDVAQGGRFRGEVYIVYHAGQLGTADVYLTHSRTGSSWSSPVLVNDDQTDYQFWPAVAVEPGGNVDVVWYDRRLDPGTSITNVFWSQSVDGGRTFRPNVRVSDVGTDWAATDTDIIPNFGDYIDVSAGGNETFAGWGDGRFGDPDAFFSGLRGVGKKALVASR
jgi:hypothetical protein